MMPGVATALRTWDVESVLSASNVFSRLDIRSADYSYNDIDKSIRLGDAIAVPHINSEKVQWRSKGFEFDLWVTLVALSNLSCIDISRYKGFPHFLSDCKPIEQKNIHRSIWHSHVCFCIYNYKYLNKRLILCLTKKQTRLKTTHTSRFSMIKQLMQK